MIPDYLVERFTKNGLDIPQDYLYVNVALQRMLVIQHGRVRKEYSVSTAAKGIGNQENSLKTPPGIHRVGEKIGAQKPLGTVFRDRVDTGEVCIPNTPGDNMILSRIMWLEGCEEGINRGPGIDTKERYVYIHGTNKEDRVGTPLSHGCVVMKNSDVIELFDLIDEGTYVIID